MEEYKYTIEKNSCKCHPETCCCNPWVVMKGGEKIITVFDLTIAALIVGALNAYQA